MQEGPPLSCLLALFEETAAGGFCGPIDPVALARAEAAFSAVAQWPPFPQAQLSSIVEETLDGLVIRLVIFFYGPILVLTVLAIWLMVGAGWFGWVVGLILTLVIIVILYAFTIFLRISLANFADAIVAELEEVTTQYRAAIVDAIPRLPRAFLAGICAYVNEEWICPPTQDDPDAAHHDLDATQRDLLIDVDPASSQPPNLPSPPSTLGYQDPLYVQPFTRSLQHNGKRPPRKPCCGGRRIN